MPDLDRVLFEQDVVAPASRWWGAHAIARGNHEIFFATMGRAVDSSGFGPLREQPFYSVRTAGRRGSQAHR
jgi:hypothetical protein